MNALRYGAFLMVLLTTSVMAQDARDLPDGKTPPRKTPQKMPPHKTPAPKMPPRIEPVAPKVLLPRRGHVIAATTPDRPIPAQLPRVSDKFKVDPKGPITKVDVNDRLRDRANILTVPKAPKQVTWVVSYECTVEAYEYYGEDGERAKHRAQYLRDRWGFTTRMETTKKSPLIGKDTFTYRVYYRTARQERVFATEREARLFYQGMPSGGVTLIMLQR